MSRALPDPDAEPTITAARAAAILGISTRGALYAIEREEIPAIWVGRAVRIPTARFLAHYGLIAAHDEREAAPARTTIASAQKDIHCEQCSHHHG